MSMLSVDAIKNSNFGTKLYVAPRQLRLWGALLFLLLFIFGLFVAHYITADRYAVTLSHIHKRVEILAQSKAALLDSHLTGLERLGRHITDADIIRLFAAEKHLVESGTEQELVGPISKQMPYLRTAVSDFARKHDAVQTMVVNARGDVYMSAFDVFPLSDTDKTHLAKLIATGKSQFAPIYISGEAALLTVMRPIFPLTEMQTAPVAALIATFDISDILQVKMAPGPLAQAGERVHLMQQRAHGLEYVDLSGEKPLVYHVRGDVVTGNIVGQHDGAHLYQSAVTLDDVYGAVMPVAGTPFVVAHEYTEKAALSDYRSFQSKVYLLTLLSVIALTLVLTLFVFYVLGLRNKYRVSHQQQMLNALVRAVEIRDPYLSGHHERVARLALQVGNQMRLSTAERSTLYYAAMLSGVGKIFVPQKLLTKPGKLTAKERATVQEHVTYAAQVFDGLSFDLPIPSVIASMHERMDGSGYPKGQSGSGIPLLSRVLGVCDVYCALVKPRSYREALTVDAALDVLDTEQGKYDKGVLGVLRQIATETTVGG